MKIHSVVMKFNLFFILQFFQTTFLVEKHTSERQRYDVLNISPLSVFRKITFLVSFLLH